MDQIQIHKMIDDICSGPAPTMFYAFCLKCQDIRQFDHGQCEDCKTTFTA